MNQVTTLREALTPHQYHTTYDKEIAQKWFINYEPYLSLEVSDEEADTLFGVSFYTELEAWLHCLKHFLNDKAQTGARLKDLGGRTPLGFNWDGIVCADDVDEETNKAWLLLHGLSDVR